MKAIRHISTEHVIVLSTAICIFRIDLNHHTSLNAFCICFSCNFQSYIGYVSILSTIYLVQACYSTHFSEYNRFIGSSKSNVYLMSCYLCLRYDAISINMCVIYNISGNLWRSKQFREAFELQQTAPTVFHKWILECVKSTIAYSRVKWPNFCELDLLNTRYTILVLSNITIVFTCHQVKIYQN